ncbi:MAG: cytochrome c biogenesis protein ResB [Planctomycetes bacterium]|nr:cytochrome c biogenesis protein ResB [Planctomycetota bacterium]
MSLIAVVVLWATLTGISHISSLRAGMGHLAVLLGAAVLGAVLSVVWPGLHRWLTSIPFAVALLGAVLVLTAFGTFVLQGAPPEELVKRYGSAAAEMMTFLSLDDVFHSGAYRALLGVLALALTLVTIKRKAWRLPEWGFLVLHLGVVAVLVGGLIGSFKGLRGFIDIHEGQVVDSIQLTNRDGTPQNEQRPLGFGLRLDKFEIERYPLEYRFLVYAAEHGEYAVIASHSMKDAARWTPIGDSGEEFRLVKAYPDFLLLEELRESDDPSSGPAVQLRVYEPDGSSRPLILLAAEKGREVATLSGVALRFVWEPDAYKPEATGELPERHAVAVQGGPEIEVAPGQTYPLGGYEMKVVTFLPDFIYDTKAREGRSRSPVPNNPALKVSIRKEGGGPSEERWLFARMPEYSHGSGEGPKLVYTYQAPRKPAERELVIVGKTREVIDYRRGTEAARALLKIGGTDEDPIAPGVTIGCERLLERAEEAHVPTTRSIEWQRPVAEIERRCGETVAREFLGAGPNQALRVGEDGPVLVFDKKSDDIRAYCSRVSVVEGEKAVKAATIVVNSPLEWRGYQFYQSNYRADDLSYSGILVVKDPGLPMVYAGFVMVSIGVIFIFYLRPRIRRARIAAKRSAL